MTNLNVLKRLIFLELNELNFDVVARYIEKFPGRFNSIERLMACVHIRTIAETKYEQLEPWIQWVSIHTGLPFAEHGVFRLGDIVNAKATQFFEELENQGFSVGSVSAMNAENRLKKPAYFIPDPWTNTASDGGFWGKALSQAVAQAVNDNSQSKITFKTAFTLLLGLFRFAKLRHYTLYFKLAWGAGRAKWRKALFLDLFLHDIHLGLRALSLPNFSALFLNAGAHIQHHYFFSSFLIKKDSSLRNPSWYISDSHDPFEDMLEIYDVIIGEYLSLKDADVMIVTGLSQKPYDRIKYYYRLKKHSDFLRSVNIEYRNVIPRMTRDFLIEFDSHEQAAAAEEKLSRMCVVSDGIRLFGEIDNRGTSLFVTLTYPNNINEETKIWVDELTFYISPFTSFVAIKNGMHQAEGFAFFTAGAADFAPSNNSHVKEMHGAVLGYFGLEKIRIS